MKPLSHKTLLLTILPRSSAQHHCLIHLPSRRFRTYIATQTRRAQKINSSPASIFSDITMLYSTLAVAVAFAGVVSAQNYSTSGPLNVTSSGFPAAERQVWCSAQRTSCPEICGGRAFPNTCDDSALSYDCVCTNGAMPNISDYDQTLPSYVCAAWIKNCVLNHPNDGTGIAACRSVICGTKNASLAEANQGGNASGSASVSSMMAMSSGAATSGASTAAAATTGSAATTASQASAAAGASSTSTKTGAATALAMAQNYGTPILAAGIMAAFGLAL